LKKNLKFENFMFFYKTYKKKKKCDKLLKAKKLFPKLSFQSIKKFKILTKKF